ncbi:Histone deacetylase [Musa troglodytarum]|uniref:Histone deacetylase n=1 Tax=Musa troglodytarum TaxID=320322 RepID=A0A9E7E860_9LILI|nr:Histone deacetylase [Musa troglodytarum]
MEFWGLEVQPGKTVKVDPGENKLLHLSQASLGEVKDKGNEGVPVFVKFDNKKLVIGTLSADKCAQIQYDLVFEKEFELSHGSKNTSIYFLGYKTDIPLAQNINGKSEVKEEKPKPSAGKPNALKADASVSKSKPKIVAVKDEKPKADENDDDDDDDDEDEESEEDDSDGDEDMLDEDDDSDDEDADESSDEEEEATPKKVETGNKRPAGSALKTPAPEKKAKVISPAGNQKTGADGKKGSYVATPYPAKQGKTPANSDKSKQRTPKSAGSISCNSCSRTFNSDNALQAHTKAKHSGGK